MAAGAKLANPKLTLIEESGDGYNYGKGGNHFLAAIPGNLDVTIVVNDNHVHGLPLGDEQSVHNESSLIVKETQWNSANLSMRDVSLPG